MTTRLTDDTPAAGCKYRLYNGSLAEIQKVVPNGLKLGHKQETTMLGIIKVSLKFLQARKSRMVQQLADVTPQQQAWPFQRTSDKRSAREVTEIDTTFI